MNTPKKAIKEPRLLWQLMETHPVSLSAFWQYISNLGLTKIDDPLENHSVKLTNRIAFIAIPVILSLVIILGLSQWNREPLFVLSTSIFFLLIPILNAKGYTEAARLVLCLLLPLLIMGMSIICKTIPNEEITNTEYFDYRYVLIASSVVPPIVFNFQRKLLLFLGISPFFLSLVFFDQLHELFNVGFYQIVHDIDSYPTTTWVSSLMFLVLVTVLFMLRWSSDYLQQENTKLILSLEAAHEQIKSQNILLNKQNETLSEDIQLANQELKESNDELIKHNNELKQFSHTVSHNLRAPIAKILGIAELLKIAPEDNKKEDYLNHMFKSVRLMDSIIRDLGSILDIRRNIFRIRKEVLFRELFDDIFFNYENEIHKNDVTIETVFEVETIYTIKPYIVSILDNLFSNALKYHCSERQPKIRIHTLREGNNTIITIWDNGEGIDLDAHEDDLFKLYERFNTQIEGKGIGLYLVMKQIESLSGEVAVNSEVDVFTEFTIRLPDVEAG